MSNLADDKVVEKRKLEALLHGGIDGTIDPRVVMARRQDAECKIYDYYGKSEEVYLRYNRGEIGKDDALIELDNIYEEAYKVIPQAEPDGDITYCHCSFMVKILNR